MATADFDDFCHQICSLIHLEPPKLTPDKDGVRAFTITHRETELSFIERIGPGYGSMRLLVRFGAPPRDKADQVLANLMRANFSMMKDGLAFVQSPQSGDVFVQTVFRFDLLVPAEIAVRLDRFAEWRQLWLRDYFIEPKAGATSALSALNLA